MFLDKTDPNADRRRARRRRRWTLPLPPLGWGETLEGIEILNELPDLTGLELFARLCDVLLWMRSPEMTRNQLFRPRSRREAIQVPEPLRNPVAALRELTQQSTSVDEVAQACSKIARWAFETGYLRIASTFAHTAATVKPDDPELAFAVGQSTRNSGRYAYAEAWFQRSVGLARRKKSREMLSSAYLGLGIMHEMRGERESARATFEKAMRAAVSGNIASLAASAHQYLIPLTMSEYKEGFAHAVESLRLYPPDDPLLARLAVDAGALFSEHSHFQLAYDLYEAALPFLTRVSDRLAVYANVCRSAAALGLKHRFAEAWGEMDRIALKFRLDSRDRVLPVLYGESLVELTHGLITLHYWKHAAQVLAEVQTIGALRPQMVRTVGRLAEIVEDRGHGDQNRDAGADAVAFTTELQSRIAKLPRP